MSDDPTRVIPTDGPEDIKPKPRPRRTKQIRQPSLIDSPVSTEAEAALAECTAAGVKPADPIGRVALAFARFGTSVENCTQRMEKAASSFPGSSDELRRCFISFFSDAKPLVMRDLGWIRVGAFAASLAICTSLGSYLAFQAGKEAQDGSTAYAAATLQAAFHDGSAGGQWLAGVAMNNDLNKLAQSCADHSHPEAGGVACSIALWSKAPVATRQ